MAEDEESDSKGRWKSLRTKLLPRRQPEHDDSKNEANDLSNFLGPRAPSVTENRRPIGPKLDISAAAKWPKVSDLLGPGPKAASPELEHFRYLKPKRRPGLIVSFSERGPDIIGFGGDESEEPTIVLHRTAQPATSGREPPRLMYDDHKRSVTSPTSEVGQAQMRNVQRPSRSPIRASATRFEAFQQGLRYTDGDSEADIAAYQGLDEPSRYRQQRDPSLPPPQVRIGGTATDEAKEQHDAVRTTPMRERVDSDASKTDPPSPMASSLNAKPAVSPRRALREIRASEGRTFLSGAQDSGRLRRPGSSGSGGSGNGPGPENQYNLPIRMASSSSSSSSRSPTPSQDVREATTSPDDPAISRKPHRVATGFPTSTSDEKQSSNGNRLRPPNVGNKSRYHQSQVEKDDLRAGGPQAVSRSYQRQAADDLRPTSTSRSSQSGKSRSPSPNVVISDASPRVRSPSDSKTGAVGQQTHRDSPDLECRCYLSNFEISATDRTLFASGSKKFSPPWHRLHAVNLSLSEADPPDISRGISVTVFDDQGSFYDSTIRKQRYRVGADKPTSLAVLAEPSTERTVRQRIGYDDPEVQRNLDHAAKVTQTRQTLQIYEFAGLRDLYAFLHVASGREVRYDNPAQISIPRPRTVLSPNKSFQSFSSRVQLLTGNKGSRLNAFLDDGRSLGVALNAWDTFESVETKDGFPAVKIVDAKFAISMVDGAALGFLAVDMEDLTDLHDDVLVAFRDEKARDAFASQLPGPLKQPKGFTLKRRI